MRRTTLALAAALTLGAGVALADGPASGRAEQDFVAASDLALKGDQRGAIALYKTILEQGVAHEDVYFNLGNAYAQAGELVPAVIAWEHALRLAPGDRDTRANLEVLRKKLAAKDKLADAGAPAGEVVLADVLEPFVAHLPLAPFAWLAALANVALFASLTLGRRARTDVAKRRFGLASVASGLLLVVGLATCLGHFVVAHDPRAIVLETSELKEGPNAGYKVSGKVGGGERVRVMSEDSGFLRVLRQNGTSGWLSSKAVERI